MARPKIDFPPSADILALADATGHLTLRVTPGARTETIEIVEGKLLVKVRARPQDGAANKAVTGLLARALGIAPRCVHLASGDTSREKRFKIDV